MKNNFSGLRNIQQRWRTTALQLEIVLSHLKVPGASVSEISIYSVCSFACIMTKPGLL